MTTMELIIKLWPIGLGIFAAYGGWVLLHYRVGRLEKDVEKKHKETTDKFSGIFKRIDEGFREIRSDNKVANDNLTQVRVDIAAINERTKGGQAHG